MHAATSPIPPATVHSSAAESLPTRIERLHAEALDALRLVMNKAVESITTPEPSAADTDEAAQSPADHARTVTQRMRLALTAARDLLRYTTDGAELPSLPITREPAASEAQHTNARAATSQPEQTKTASTAAPAAASAPTHAAQSANAAARVSERTAPPRDSSLTAQNSAPTPAPQPAAAEPPNLPSVPPAADPPLPPRPNYFSQEEFKQIMAVMRSKQDRLTPALYARIIEWNHYAIPAGLSPAFGITEARLEARKPHEPDR